MNITIRKYVEKVSVGDIVIEKTTFNSNPIYGIVIEALNQNSEYFNVLVIDTDLHGEYTFYVNHDKDLTESQLLAEYDIIANGDDVSVDVRY